MKHGRGKSDGSVVPEKPSNEAAPAAEERAEGRDLAKGSSLEGNAFRTQRRGDARSALERVRQAARKDRRQRFTALFHHVYAVDRLRDAYFALKRNATKRDGSYGLQRKTIRSRWQAKLREVKTELRRRWHHPIRSQATYLRSVVGGHFRYYGVPGNGDRLAAFRFHLIRLWRRTLERRSQRGRIPWKRMNRYAALLPPPEICHPWPAQRFDVITQGGSRMR